MFRKQFLAGVVATMLCMIPYWTYGGEISTEQAEPGAAAEESSAESVSGAAAEESSAESVSGSAAEGSSAESLSGAVISPDGMIFADETVAGWHIVVEKVMTGATLNNVSVDLGYTGVEVSEFAQEAKDGCVYYALKLLMEKTGGTELIEWEKMILSDSQGNEYHRIDDAFLTDLGLKHMSGNSLNFGYSEGWIAYEIPEDAEGLTLSYAFSNETFSCSVDLNAQVVEGAAESEAAQTEAAAEDGVDEAVADGSAAEGTTDSDAEANAGDGSEESAAQTEASPADDTAGSDESTDAGEESAAAAASVSVPGNAVEETDPFAKQNSIDAMLQEEVKNAGGFTDPTVIVDPYGASPLTAVVIFRTDAKTGGSITVKGKEAENDITGTFEPATEHIVPVYGLYNGEATQVEMTLDDGTTNTLEITTEKQDLEFGEFEAQMIDAEAYDYSKLTFIYPFGGTIYAVDSVGDIRWCYSGGGSMGVHPLENGHLMVPSAFMLKSTYYKEGLQEIDLTGKIYNRYAIPGGQHHDFQEMPNGNLLVAGDAADLSSIEDCVVEIDRETGEVVWSLDMKDLLPTDTGRSASMDTDGSEELDWCHNNSIWYDENTDRVLLSARHLDAIIAVNRSDKTLAWILGDPTGWEGVDPELFFTPQGDDFEWQYAQHQVTMLDNGDIMLFDNGTAKVKRINAKERVTGDDVYSRAVIYRINTEDMTVSQVFQYGKERGPEWYADWVSGVESQDGTGDNLWITAGSHLYNPEEDRCDYYPKDMMIPGLIKSTIIDQVVNGELVYELVISGDTYLSLAFRSSRISMYDDSCAQDITTAPKYLGGLGVTAAERVVLNPEDTLPSEVWTYEMDSVKLSVNGTYLSEHAADEIGEDSLVLSNGIENRYYPVTQYKTESEDGSGTSVSVSGWLSREGLEGTWNIWMLLDGTLYDTGYTFTPAGAGEESAENAEAAAADEDVAAQSTEAAAPADGVTEESTEATAGEDVKETSTEGTDTEKEDGEDAEAAAADAASAGETKKESESESESETEDSMAFAEDAEDSIIVSESLKSGKFYGYYGRLIDTRLDMDDLQQIEENDASSELLSTDIPVEKTLVEGSLHIDQMVEDELASGNYSFEDPLVIQNPYQNAPLTGLIVFSTEEECRIRVTVKGISENVDISGVLDAATDHRVPVVGLYPGTENTVLVQKLGDDDSVLEENEIKITTDPLPEAFDGAVDVVKSSGDSAYQLTVVYGQGSKLPFAYDCNGDIRWYMDFEVGNYGLYTLSNGRMIMQSCAGYSPNYQKPQTTNLYEMDYLGRFYRMYYVANGTHHEVIEKVPGGNLLVLTSSMKNHYEDEIIEMDRETGEIVNSLELGDIFGDTYTDMVDWAHINTVSWQEDGDTILLSCRNLHSIMKIGWTDHQLKWILSDPGFWEETPFAEYVLAPEGEFAWQYQQHSAYQLEEDLDGNPETVEISVFDNHTSSYRKAPTYDELPNSYLLVYAVNEEQKTVGRVKNLEVIRSAITSNTIYDGESGHIFGMCGHLSNDTYYKRRGMNYEFDYETGELLNQYTLKKTFYRASPMLMNFNDLASKMEVEENYIKGTLKKCTKADTSIEVPQRVLTQEEVTATIVGRVLYVSAADHSISQVIFQGESNTYVYDIATFPQFSQKYQELVVATTIPMQNLEPDTYEIVCVYKDEAAKLGQTVTIPV